VTGRPAALPRALLLSAGTGQGCRRAAPRAYAEGMSDSTPREGQQDPSDAPEYRQLGEDGNPFSGAGSDGAAADAADGTSADPSVSDGTTTTGAVTGGTDASGADSTTDAGLDQVPNAAAEDDDAVNPPLPDWGPTDGTHGVDGADPDA